MRAWPPTLHRSRAAPPPTVGRKPRAARDRDDTTSAPRRPSRARPCVPRPPGAVAAGRAARSAAVLASRAGPFAKSRRPIAEVPFCVVVLALPVTFSALPVFSGRPSARSQARDFHFDSVRKVWPGRYTKWELGKTRTYPWVHAMRASSLIACAARRTWPAQNFQACSTLISSHSAWPASSGRPPPMRRAWLRAVT